MSNKVTASYFLTDYLNKNDIKLGEVLILEFIYRWIFSSKTPETIIHNDKLYFYICMNYVADNFSIVSRQSISSYFRHWKEIGLILDTLDKTVKVEYTSVQKHYICFDFEKIKESLAPKELLPVDFKNDWFDYIDKYLGSKSYNNSEEKKMLFELDEKKPKYDVEAYSIVKKIIEKSKKENNEYFKHKYNEYGEEQTKLMTKACQFVQTIHDGNFLNPRRFALSEKFLNNQQFPIELSRIKEKLNEVKGDWKKVKKLILSAYENFNLMHDENHCPCNKDYLNKSLSDWFYGYSDEAGKYQSQFIQCLFEVPLTKKFYSEKKADNIFEKLNGKSQDYGEELIDLNPKMNPGIAWENIKKMVEWVKLVLTVEPNAKYWIETPSHIIKKFAEWAKNNNIQINTNSFNIEWCVENNGPWVWFVQKAIQEYKLNYQLSSLVDESDFLDCYNSEIVF